MTTDEDQKNADFLSDKRSRPVGEWWLDGYGSWNIKGCGCWIFLNPRPAYCNRGSWSAHVEVDGTDNCFVSESDFWPRYYFGLNIAKQQCELWLLAHNQIEHSQVISFDRRPITTGYPNLSEGQAIPPGAVEISGLINERDRQMLELLTDRLMFEQIASIGGDRDAHKYIAAIHRLQGLLSSGKKADVDSSAILV